MKNTKIDWCDSTLNPVVGCKNKCTYCYARKLNNRFGFIPNWEKPQFFPERLKELNSKKGKSIFMNSMSDISFWKEEWIQIIMNAIDINSQHKYIFLTKARNLPFKLSLKDAFHHSNNMFFGKTITTQSNIYYTDYCNFDFWSIEPLLGPIKIKKKERLKQIIIGAETGNRKEKIIPLKKWVDDIVKQCDELGIPVFMKESLKEIMGKDFRQDDLIWRIKK